MHGGFLATGSKSVLAMRPLQSPSAWMLSGMSFRDRYESWANVVLFAGAKCQHGLLRLECHSCRLLGRWHHTAATMKSQMPFNMKRMCSSRFCAKANPTDLARFVIKNRAFALLALLAFCAGCRGAGKSDVRVVTPEVLLKVHGGISQEQLEIKLGAPARHEFTAVHESRTAVRCVSYYFPSFHLKYYFVFTNGGLDKLILPPRFAHELSASERGQRAEWKSHDPQERMQVTLQAPPLNDAGIRASIENRYKPEKFDHALPGAVLAGIIGAPVALARGAVENASIKSLAQRFDPFRISLGISVAEANRLFGEPVLVEEFAAGSETRHYGSPKLGIQLSPLWLTVVFKDGKAVQVFSDDFFNYRKVEPAVREKADK